MSAVATAVNWAVGLVLLRAGTAHRSVTLSADGKHLLTDVWTSAGVIVGVYREDVTLAFEVVEGPPVVRLMEASRHAGLLVVGSRGYGIVREILVVSVAAGCIRNATCPVVVLPAPHLEPLELQALQPG